MIQFLCEIKCCLYLLTAGSEKRLEESFPNVNPGIFLVQALFAFQDRARLVYHP